jgi:hypothetical protein
MQSATRWFLALTALVALRVPRASYPQQMNFSFYADYYFSDDGSTLYTVVDGSDNSTGCTHVNYSTTGYANGPTGTVRQTTAGLSSTVGIPVGAGNFNFSWGSDLVLDCSCFGPGLDAGGGGSSPSMVKPIRNGGYSIPNARAGTPRDRVFSWPADGSNPALDAVRIDVVNEMLPIAEAVKQVERRFGRVVTYEDVPYVAPRDLVDITDQVAKVNPRATHVVVRRRDSIRLAYMSRYGTLDAQAGEALAQLLAVWNGGDYSGKFRVERVVGGYHVIPVGLATRHPDHRAYCRTRRPPNPRGPGAGDH